MLIKFVILSVTMCCSLLTVITIIYFAFLFFPFLRNVLGSSSLVSQVKTHFLITTTTLYSVFKRTILQALTNPS